MLELRGKTIAEVQDILAADNKAMGIATAVSDKQLMARNLDTIRDIIAGKSEPCDFLETEFWDELIEANQHIQGFCERVQDTIEGKLSDILLSLFSIASRQLVKLDDAILDHVSSEEENLGIIERLAESLSHSNNMRKDGSLNKLVNHIVLCLDLRKTPWRLFLELEQDTIRAVNAPSDGDPSLVKKGQEPMFLFISFVDTEGKFHDQCVSLTHNDFNRTVIVSALEQAAKASGEEMKIEAVINMFPLSKEDFLLWSKEQEAPKKDKVIGPKLSK